MFFLYCGITKTKYNSFFACFVIEVLFFFVIYLLLFLAFLLKLGKKNTRLVLVL